jgi:hypothetical protein
LKCKNSLSGTLVRRNSPKQTQASRKNGSNSKGPQSAAGKKTAAQNAIHDGLFSRQVVIEQLGEQKKDFENIKNTLWEFFRPASALEELLVADFVENWWRRERIRRAEAVELRNRLETLAMRGDLRRADEVKKIRSRFLVLYGKYVAALSSRSQDSLHDITAELEDVRTELASTTPGIDFLLESLGYLERKAKEKGVLSTEDEVLVQACCGFGSEEARTFLNLNLISRRESQKSAPKNPRHTGPPPEEVSADQAELLTIVQNLRRNMEPKFETPEFERSEEPKSKQSSSEKMKTEGKESVQGERKREHSIALAAGIAIASTALRMRQQQFKIIEASEAQAGSSIAVLNPSISDRFSRAETAVERRMYRALALLAAMRAEDPSKLLP